MIFVIIAFIFCTSCKAQQLKFNKSNYNKYLVACDNYVRNCKMYPDSNSDISITGGARILMPPDSINKFLFYCISMKDYSALKYAIAILLKLGKYNGEININNSILSTLAGCENGFVEMIKINMGIPKVYYDDFGEKILPCLFPKYTHDVIIWSKKNKEKIIDYKYLE